MLPYGVFDTVVVLAVVREVSMFDERCESKRPRTLRLVAFRACKPLRAAWCWIPSSAISDAALRSALVRRRSHQHRAEESERDSARDRRRRGLFKRERRG